MFLPAQPVLAVKTLQAIEDTLFSDQGNLFRKYLEEELPQASDAYKQYSTNYRSHLGASLIGKECSRALWYSFHWTVNTKHSGRMIRLFNRGHLEEARFTALLRMIGCRVWCKDDAGRQFRISGHMKHFGGSLDGVALNVPDDPETPMLLEYKTHSDKNYRKLQDNGVRVAKPEHYIQMQNYMGGWNLTKALYLAANKNDDDLYGEIITYDPESHERAFDRAGQIILAVEPPPKINESPSWYTCKFCDFKSVCHGGQLPAMNCRTCQFSTPGENGVWKCTRDNADLPESTQLTGCPDYRWNPSI